MIVVLKKFLNRKGDEMFIKELLVIFVNVVILFNVRLNVFISFFVMNV